MGDSPDNSGRFAGGLTGSDLDDAAFEDLFGNVDHNVFADNDNSWEQDFVTPAAREAATKDLFGDEYNVLTDNNDNSLEPQLLAPIAHEAPVDDLVGGVGHNTFADNNDNSWEQQPLALAAPAHPLQAHLDEDGLLHGKSESQPSQTQSSIQRPQGLEWTSPDTSDLVERAFASLRTPPTRTEYPLTPNLSTLSNAPRYFDDGSHQSRGVRRDASHFEGNIGIPQPGITPHGGLAGVAGHYSRAPPQSSFSSLPNSPLDATGGWSNVAPTLATNDQPWSDTSLTASRSTGQFSRPTFDFSGPVRYPSSGQQNVDSGSMQRRPVGNAANRTTPASFQSFQTQASDAMHPDNLFRGRPRAHLSHPPGSSMQPPSLASGNDVTTGYQGVSSFPASESRQDPDGVLRSYESISQLRPGMLPQQFSPPMISPSATGAGRQQNTNTPGDYGAAGIPTDPFTGSTAYTSYTGYIAPPTGTSSPYATLYPTATSSINSDLFGRSQGNISAAVPDFSRPHLGSNIATPFMPFHSGQMHLVSDYPIEHRRNAMGQRQFGTILHDEDRPSPIGEAPAGIESPYSGLQAGRAPTSGYNQNTPRPDEAVQRSLLGEQRVVTQYKDYTAPVTLFEIVPNRADSDYAQSWIASTLFGEPPAPPLTYPSPTIEKRFYHSTKGFIPDGNKRSLIILHNAAFPWEDNNGPASTMGTTTIGVYGYHWYEHEWIYWVTVRPSLKIWFSLKELERVMRKVKTWTPDMVASERRFHRAYWLAANTMEMGGILHRAETVDPVDPDALADDELPKLKLEDLDDDCGLVSAADMADANDVVFGRKKLPAYKVEDHVVVGDPEDPLYRNLISPEVEDN